MAACVGAVVVARVVTRFHWDPGLAALAGSWVPPDLGVFLEAGEAVVRGEGPYRDASDVGQDFGYVYPPLLAWVISPLSLLPHSWAASLWTLLMAASLVGGLRMLGVVDVRCYAVALLCPFSRAGFEYGTIGSLLFLLVAATWMFRDRPTRAAVSAAAAIATKLFLWPLALWLLATRRSRTAVFTLAATIALVLVPWAAIRFSGFVQYPELLEKAGQRQGYRSYSFEALVQSLGTSRGIAVAASWALGLSLIALGFRLARREGLSDRDRDRLSLTVVLAASLVLTPIVWLHYLVLVLIPVALAYPTFSAVWLAVLASAILDVFPWYRASPDGDLLPVAIVAILVTALIALCTRIRDSSDSDRRGASTTRWARRHSLEQRR